MWTRALILNRLEEKGPTISCFYHKYHSSVNNSCFRKSCQLFFCRAISAWSFFGKPDSNYCCSLKLFEELYVRHDSPAQPRVEGPRRNAFEVWLRYIGYSVLSSTSIVWIHFCFSLNQLHSQALHSSDLHSSWTFVQSKWHLTCLNTQIPEIISNYGRTNRPVQLFVSKFAFSCRHGPSGNLKQARRKEF